MPRNGASDRAVTGALNWRSNRRQNSSQVPENWDVLTIGEMFSRRMERGRAGLPVMSITMAGGLVERSSVERRVDSNLPPEGHLLVRAGDLAYNMMRMWQGVLGRGEFDCLVSPAYIVLQPNERMEPEFAEYLLSNGTAVAQFKRMSYGVVDDRLRLYYRDLVRIPFAVPRSRAEQRWIANILRTLDEAIERTEALIAKHQVVKEGLMRDLLTRGVAPNGQLRPSPTESPDLYEKDAHGWIPHQWRKSTLGECCDWSSGGTPRRAKTEWWIGEIPWLTPKDMKAFELSDTSEHISDEAARVASRTVGAGAVFVVVRGMILAHSFPVVLGLRDFAFNQDVKALQPHSGLSSRFLAYWLTANRDEFLKLTTEATHGTKRLELKHLLQVPIGLPGCTEQNAIVERLDSVAVAISGEHELAAKLRSQKLGFMRDLLTGRVRIALPAMEQQPA